MRVVFFGTPDFAVPTLSRLLAGPHEVVAVVTQPDRPRGRGQRLQPSAIKAVATGRAPVLHPERLADPDWLGTLAALSPDLGVVAAYGRLLPQVLLDLPRLGMINVHASLLPRWRGAAPVHRAVLAGDTETGISIMRVVRALDAGPVLARAFTPIGPDETSAELEARLATIGASLLADTADRLAAGPVAEEAQDERLVTYAQRLDRSEREVDWHRPARTIHNQIRGLQPWPVAAARLGGQRVLLRRSAVADDQRRSTPPGVIERADRDGLVVAASPGAVRLTEIQVEGRPAVSVSDFLHGRRIGPGDRFEPLDVER
jgi:methionyl-tRNA formyltransferase